LADKPGLSLAWAGGTPPYAVKAEGKGAVQVLARNLTETFLWLPDWRVPVENVRLDVRDAQNQQISLTSVRPVPALPSSIDAELRGIGSSGLAAAVLFETGGPGWRLEALRGLVPAAADDPIAAQALALIRETGTTGQ
jgi:hypothetical protein